MWAPMRARGAGLLQLLLMSIGLAFLIRSRSSSSGAPNALSSTSTSPTTVQFLGLSIGRTQLIVIIDRLRR